MAEDKGRILLLNRMQQVIYRFSGPVELPGNFRLAKSPGQQLLNQEFFSLSGFRFAREIPLLDLSLDLLQFFEKEVFHRFRKIPRHFFI